MLDHVRESEQTSLATDHSSEVLRDIGIIAAVNFGAKSVHGVEEFVGFLFIHDIFKVILAALAES